VPPTPPQKKPDRHYDFRRTNVVFALSSLALLAISLLMVMMDFGRPWKRYQAEFRDLERASFVAKLEVERESLNNDSVATVQAETAAEQARLVERQGDIAALEDEIATLDKRVFESDKRMRSTKSRLDAAKYEYDVALQRGSGVDAALAKADDLTSRWIEYTKETEAYIDERQIRRDSLAAEHEALEASEDRLAVLRSAMNGLEIQLSTVEKNLDYFMLNAPLMDFLAPSMQIEQVIVSGLYHDIKFAKIDRVDRCVTCHVPVARAGFDGEGWEQPYRSHPRLDLFVADSSPHPYGQFGCTGCHGGLDRATDFSRAGHTPGSEVQLADWKNEYSWKPAKFLEAPIRALHLSESGCLSCHADEVWTPGSTTLEVGRQIINKAGCHGCHRIGYEAFRDVPRVGPDLLKVAGKLDDGWAAKWVEAPREFRSTTWMPHFFYQENIEGELNEARQRAEIESIVDFLWSVSEEEEYPDPPAGDATRGEGLFFSVGCTGCHIVDGEAKRSDYVDKLNRLHGPNLTGVGSKTSPGWLFAWVKNPKEYRPDSPMPNLRLTDREAADVVAFLVQQRNPAFEGLGRESVDPEVRAELLGGYLRNQMTIEQSEVRLAEMSAEEQSIELGSQSVAKYGCYSCHAIAGFEDTQPIGVELTEEASKPIHLFDFGHLHDLSHTHLDWLSQKIQHPRSFDHGKELVLNYNELTRMPDFGFTDEERDLVLTNVLGFTKESVREEFKAARGERGEKLAAGRRLVTRYNCQGCHLIEEVGHAIKEALLDENNLPPNLAAQGARTQAGWLFEYLHDPGKVRLRPWLEVRMPTFDFSDEEANSIVAYFATLDGRTPFASTPESGSTRSLAVGEEVFKMLQCAKCHPAGGETSSSEASAGELAPALTLAVARLRHDWVDDWIKDPQRWIPGTKMPTNFPANPDGSFSSPLGIGINQATFAGEKRRMMRHFSSEEELNEYLGDVDSVTAALRDHLWTLSE
jgi:cytochrome c2